MPELSIVIPTLGRETLIPTVESLRRARLPPGTEIIVAGKVEDPSVAARLAQLKQSIPGLVHLDVSFDKGDSSRKKNAGFEKSRGAIVAFLDDDVVVEPDWAEMLLETFADPKTGLVSGPALIPGDIPRMGRLAGLALASPAAGYVAARYHRGPSSIRTIRWSEIIGCNMAYRREAFEAMGQFDPAFWPGEEMIAAFKTQQLGFGVKFHSGACVHHYPRQSLARFYRQIHGYGATRIRLMRAGVEWEWSTLAPAAWVASLLLLGIGSLVHQWCAYLLAVDLLLYALVDFWCVIAMLRDTRCFSDVLLFLMIPVMHFSYGLAEWIELLRPGRDLSEKEG